ncbi:MAG: hypothetical protein A2493_01010 [Candidatus Magasanikbacteria bacterium RIFOXYC12_FULL_33_11]|uniref:Uncharacterized protein n=1 Tax=Candidatus Magasanikbacteria bacterium RIFOXYC12_FULL_33_11 TaxID=1798701 RepID=A0A1F6NR03_9BACT|nr:MAG: hypothetical protein A2493_01010 [Candidatus Magasanikbacteria bacterium RIFOXYC12_FULL_33_11]
MSLGKKIAHNTITQMTGKILSTFLGLAAMAMLTRYLGDEKFGWYITTISFLGFLGILIDFGMTPVTAQMLGENKFEKTKLFSNILTFRFFTALIFLSIAPLTAFLFPYPHTVKIAILFTSISFFAITLNQVFIGFLQERLTMQIQAFGEVISRIVLVVGLFLAISGRASFYTLMWVIVAASISYTLSLYLYIRKKTKITFSFDRKIWLTILQKMWPIAIAIIFNVVYLRGDVLVLSYFREQSVVGIYGAAYRVIDLVIQTAMMVMGVMLPLLANSWVAGNKQEFQERYQMSFDAMMLIALPMFTGLFLLSHQIMLFVAGESFYLSGDALKILSLAVLGVFLGGIFGHLAVAVNMQKKVMWVYISNAIITLIGYLIFIPRYGMYGAAWMTVFSEFYTALLIFFSIRKSFYQPLKLKLFLKIILANIIMGLFIMLVLKKLPLLMTIIFSGLVYILVLIISRTVSKEQLKDLLTLKN